MFDVKQFMKDNKLTQSELANYLGVTQGFISQVVNGQRDFPKKALEKISEEGVYVIPSVQNITNTAKAGDNSVSVAGGVVNEIHHSNDELIAALRSQIADLKQQLNQKDAQIEWLQSLFTNQANNKQ